MPIDDGYRTVDPAVLKRLKRLDKDLLVTHSRYSINPFDGCIIEVPPGTIDPVSGEDVSGPVEDPHFYLWIKCNDGAIRLVQMTPEFGHKEVAKLEGDLARFMDPGEIVKSIVEKREAYIRKQAEAMQEEKHERTKANAHRAMDLLQGKTGQRDAKVASYPGQKDRSTPGTILPDAKEDGWEGIEN